jgi:anti-sigma-K factor RskA
VITLAVEVPIDNRIQTWTAATLPADWRSIQSRWELWHTIRTFLSIAAVIAVTISAAVTARHSAPPVAEIGAPGAAATGGRPA